LNALTAIAVAAYVDWFCQLPAHVIEDAGS
jgi:hypothetical protein